MSAKGPNSGPHVCMASILCTVPSFQLHNHGFFEANTKVFFLIFDSRKQWCKHLSQVNEYLDVIKHSTMLLWYLATGGFLWVSYQGLGLEAVLPQTWLPEWHTKGTEAICEYMMDSWFTRSHMSLLCLGKPNSVNKSQKYKEISSQVPDSVTVEVSVVLFTINSTREWLSSSWKRR